MHDQNEVIPQSWKFYLVQPFKGDITYHNMIFISNTWIQKSYLIMSYHSHVISGFRRVPLRRKIKALIQQTVWTSFSGYKYYCWFKTSRTRWCGECRTIHRVSWITGDSPKYFHPQYWNPEKYGEKKNKKHDFIIFILACLLHVFVQPADSRPPNHVNTPPVSTWQHRPTPNGTHCHPDPCLKDFGSGHRGERFTGAFLPPENRSKPQKERIIWVSTIHFQGRFSVREKLRHPTMNHHYPFSREIHLLFRHVNLLGSTPPKKLTWLFKNNHLKKYLLLTLVLFHCRVSCNPNKMNECPLEREYSKTGMSLKSTINFQWMC